MASESMFLRAIADQPDELTVRLAYADWLDERSEPLAKFRAETVRHEAALSVVPVFSDRFWELKTRHAKPHPYADRSWLTAMGYADPYRLHFNHGIPDGYEERWRLIRAFTETWYGKPMPDIGGHAEQVAAVEQRLGRTFAPSIREWIAFAQDTASEMYPDKPLFARSGYDIDLGGLPGFDGFTIARYDGDGGTAYEFVTGADTHEPDPLLTEMWSPVDETDANLTPRYTAAPKTPHRNRITTFALSRAVIALSGACSCCTHVPEAEVASFVSRMRSEFPARFVLGATEVFEAPELLVTLSPTAYAEPGLRMHATARRLPRGAWERLPAVFREHVSAVAKHDGPVSTSVTETTAFRMYFKRQPTVPRVKLIDE